MPVLSGVILAFVAAAAWAVMRAKRMLAGTEVGSLNWFLDSLKLDLEVLARSLSQAQPQAPSQPEPEPQPERSQVSDAA